MILNESVVIHFSKLFHSLSHNIFSTERVCGTENLVVLVHTSKTERNGDGGREQVSLRRIRTKWKVNFRGGVKLGNGEVKPLKLENFAIFQLDSLNVQH